MLRAFGRLLPKEFRERVWTPAWEELRGGELSRGARWPAKLAGRAILFAEGIRLGMPQYVWRRGRLTGAGKAILVVLLLAALVIQRSRYPAHGG